MKEVHINWGGFASVVLFLVLQKYGYGVYYSSPKFYGQETFISIDLLQTLESFLPNFNYTLPLYDSYFFQNGEMHEWDKLAFLWKNFFSKAHEQMSKQSLPGTYRWDRVFDWVYDDQAWKYDKEKFGDLTVCIMEFDNMKKSFALEYYNAENIPSYFYHIWKNLYIYAYFDLLLQPVDELLDEILWVELFDNFSKSHTLKSKKIIDISHTIVDKSCMNNSIFIWSNLGKVPPFLGLWNKIVFTDALLILDFLQQSIPIEKFHSILHDYRLFFYTQWISLWRILSSERGTKIWEVKMYSTKIHKHLDAILQALINKYR